MSAFSPEWLALREPADEAARHPGLAARLFDFVHARRQARFVDLGCGTGANLRAIAAGISPDIVQTWRLLDHDSALLDAARKSLVAWADHTEEKASTLVLLKDSRTIIVSFEMADIDRHIEGAIHQGEIATASAFFDLVSREWIDRFTAAAVQARAPVYAVLSYNGREVWSPPHPADGPVLAAFLMHQRRDKGFGKACGPDGAAVLEQALHAKGYQVATGDSPWCLAASDAGLIAALAEGSASAVATLDVFDAAVLNEWTEKRRIAISCIIGHTDLLAFPPS